MLIILLNYSGKSMVRFRFKVNVIKTMINLITSRLNFRDMKGAVGYGHFKICD